MKRWHLWVAALTGVLAVGWMLADEFDIHALAHVDFSATFWGGVALALILFGLQNLMFSCRFHMLVRGQTSLFRCFRVNVLCEFTSAVTPSAVGGIGLVFLYLHREGVSMGRSVFAMFAALLADELFLAVCALLLYIAVPAHLLFGVDVPASCQAASCASQGWITEGLRWAYLSSMGVVAAWALALYVMLLRCPGCLGWLMGKCCRVPFLRRFHASVEHFSGEMALASAEARSEKGRFWLHVMGSTVMAWLFRFAIVTAVLMALRADGNMAVAWCRQCVMWLISLLSPTPGGSGVAELMFRRYYSDFFSDASLVILAVMLWRLVFYYPFLFMGAVMLPKWVKDK